MKTNGSFGLMEWNGMECFFHSIPSMWRVWQPVNGIYFHSNGMKLDVFHSIKKAVEWLEWNRKINRGMINYSNISREITKSFQSPRQKPHFSSSTKPSLLPRFNPDSGMEDLASHEIPSQTGPGKNKKNWSKEEDAALVQSLLELVDAGTHKSDNGFKSGYLHVLEQNMAAKGHPTIKGNPHIQSRIKILKRDYGLYHELLTSYNMSGFGYDQDTKCVTADATVWDDFLQNPKNARFKAMRKKPFPHYDDLHLVFGNDRANGNASMSFTEMADIGDREDTNTTMGNEDPFGEIPSPNNTQTSRPSLKRKRNATTEAMATIASAMTVIGEKIEKTADVLYSAIRDTNKIELQQKLMAELKRLGGFSTAQRMSLVQKIGMNEDRLHIFYGMSDEDKLDFLISLTNDSEV